MKKEIKTIRHSHKRIGLITTCVVILVALAGWWVFSVFTKPEPTYPLGSSFEYIGKNDYGCNGFCASEPNSTYYYATNLSVDEVINHLPHTEIVKNPVTVKNKTYFGIKMKTSETVYFYHYQDANELFETYPQLSKTDKRHVLSLPSFKYSVVRDLL